MFGTIVNTTSIIIGCILGLFIKGGIPEKFSDSLTEALGLCVLFIGIQGAVKTENTLLLIICMVIGTLIGEFLDIDKALNRLGDRIQGRFKKAGAFGDISKGFVSASLLFCIGSMAIVGSLESGLKGDHDILFAKSILDGITSIIYTSTMGIGVIFSAVAVFIYQGTITLGAGFLKGVLTDSAIINITGIGSLMIIAISLNMLKITKIKVANLLPALFCMLVYYIIVWRCF